MSTPAATRSCSLVEATRLQLDLGMLRAELGQSGHQPVRGESDAGGHGELAGAAMAPDVDRDVGDVVEAHAHGAVQARPVPGELQLAALPQEHGAPRCCSSSWIWRLTADWVSASSSPARVKLRCRPAASRTTKLFAGGNAVEAEA